MKQDYVEFQIQTTPLAYFIGIRTYGTWFHGDERGSVNRRRNNIFNTAKISANRHLRNYESSLLKHTSSCLDEPQRLGIETAIREVCDYREYKLFALQARTNHVHIVVFGNRKPEFIMNSIKAYSTRRLRESGLLDSEQKLWSRHGSTIYLWTEEEIERTVEYVVVGQGDKLQGFE